MPARLPLESLPTPSPRPHHVSLHAAAARCTATGAPRCWALPPTHSLPLPQVSMEMLEPLHAAPLTAGRCPPQTVHVFLARCLQVSMEMLEELHAVLDSLAHPATMLEPVPEDFPRVGLV